jgi:hypothetical protein
LRLPPVIGDWLVARFSSSYNAGREAEGALNEPVNDWEIYCDPETFARCVGDERFAHIVTLARAVNALRFVHVAMVHAGMGDAPEAKRARFNSYLFASAILYESLRLIKAMNKTFKDDTIFQNGLRLLLRDKIAQAVERIHLDRARNEAVFHFFPDRFASMLENTTSDKCTFVLGRGNANRDVYYSFADVVAGEILVGYAADSEEFYAQLGEAMANTRDLVVRFANEAERLIGHHLKQWGFVMATIPAPGPAENQSQG